MVDGHEGGMTVTAVRSQQVVTAAAPAVPPRTPVTVANGPATDATTLSPTAAHRVPLQAVNPALSSALRPRPATFLKAQNPTPKDLATAIARMKAIETDLIARHDGRAVFVSTYLQILRATDESVRQPGYFEDPACVTAEALRFVQYYLDNYAAYERGDMANVAKPWKSAFDRAASGKGLAFENLILGINAHVNYDLPRALAVVNAHTPAQQRDFQKFNSLLFDRIDAIQAEVVGRYTSPQGHRGERVLDAADKALGSLDERATKALFTLWRNRAWQRRGELLQGQVTALDRMVDAAHRPVLAVAALGFITPFHACLVKHQVA
jgi:hypothetical protein